MARGGLQQEIWLTMRSRVYSEERRIMMRNKGLLCKIELIILSCVHYQNQDFIYLTRDLF